MQTILDLYSKTNKVIRFIFTPAKEPTLFKTIRDHDLISIVDRSIPTRDKFLKNHGTLILGDPPLDAIESSFVKENLSEESTILLKQWVKLLDKRIKNEE